MGLIDDRTLTADQLKERIDNWIHEAGLTGLRVIFAPDIPAEIDRYRKEGKLSNDDRTLLQRNGFIDATLWNLQLKDGMLPVMDRHDLFFHLPSFLLPGFQRACPENGVREPYTR